MEPGARARQDHATRRYPALRSLSGGPRAAPHGRRCNRRRAPGRAARGVRGERLPEHFAAPQRRSPPFTSTCRRARPRSWAVVQARSRDFVALTRRRYRLHQLRYEFIASFLQDAQPGAPRALCAAVPMPGATVVVRSDHRGRVLPPFGPGRVASAASNLCDWRAWCASGACGPRCVAVLSVAPGGVPARYSGGAREFAESVSMRKGRWTAPHGHPEEVAAVAAEATASDGRRDAR